MKEGVLPPHFHTCWRKYCLVLDNCKNIAKLHLVFQQETMISESTNFHYIKVASEEITPPLTCANAM